MSRVEFRVLGRPEVHIDGERLDLGAPKQQVVLAALLLRGVQVVSTNDLAEAVWWTPPAAAHANLRTYLARLRRLLRPPGEPESRLQTLRGGHRLRVLAGELDRDLFDELADEGEHSARRGRLLVAADRLARARRLWRGPALGGVEYGPGLQATVAALEERRLAVTERWAEVQLGLGHHEEITAELRGLVLEQPLRERLWASLMTALHRSGRPSEALAAYAQASAVLAEELGCDPGPELQRLHRQLLRGGPPPAVPGQPAPAPAGAAPTAPLGGTVRAAISPRQLLARPGTFCGRTTQLAWLGRLLATAGTRPSPVVVAIGGPAGVGKSALALVAAHQAAEHFPDGQLYINLQGATMGLDPLPPVEVLGRFLRALGVLPAAVPGDEAEAAALFRSLLARRRVLVVLDDAGSPAQVRPLLPGGPGCATVITGRTVLTGLMEVSSLHLGLVTPVEAVELLGAVAGAHRTAAEPEETARLAALCGHLPLALRIAGARLAARPGWPVAGLADRLAAAQRRLDELATADIAIRASIGLTYQGLAEESRQALRRLATCRAPDFAPWALAALLDVPTSQAELLLDDLCRVQLLEVVSTRPDGPRYQIHDLVRLFAQERAAEEDLPAVRATATRRLVEASLALAERADVRLSADFLGVAAHRTPRWSLPAAEVARLTADPVEWFDREHRFLVAAVDEGLDIGLTETAGCLTVSLTTFFQVRNHFQDWRRVNTRALAAAVQLGDRRTAMKLHRGLGELDTIQDRYDEAITHFKAALGFGAAEDPEYEAALTAGLGYLYRLRGRYEPALRHFDRGRHLAEATGNLNGLVYATNGIGVVHLERGRLVEAGDCFDESLRVSRKVGYLPGEAQSLRGLGQVERAAGRHDRATELFRQAGELSDSLGDRLGEAHAHCWLGEMRFRQGRNDEGSRLFAKCLRVYREFGNAWGEAATLYAIATAQLGVGRPGAALRQARRATEVWRRIGSPYWLALGLDTLSGAYDGLGQQADAENARREAACLRGPFGEDPRGRPGEDR